ncbi:recombinase family protein [Amycolatopsis pithecellobii]|uniref:recombinase family protein n=1 Tax=Amycolatopsis pithecellobii TaxID=664692 RepID=UPI001FE88744|nr:recombinase family protein [Amycolatopsis pithecellobii]
MAAVRGSVIGVLLVYRVDRFSRNLRDMVMLLDDSTPPRSCSGRPPNRSTLPPMGRMLVGGLVDLVAEGAFAAFPPALGGFALHRRDDASSERFLQLHHLLCGQRRQSVPSNQVCKALINQPLDRTLR